MVCRELFEAQAAPKFRGFAVPRFQHVKVSPVVSGSKADASARALPDPLT